MAITFAPRRSDVSSLEIGEQSLARRYVLSTRRIDAEDVTSIHRYTEMSGEPSFVVRAGWFRQIAVPVADLELLHHAVAFRSFVAAAAAAGASVDARLNVLA